MRDNAKRAILVILVLLVLFGLFSALYGTPVANAHTFWGDTAKSTAKHINCKNFTRNGGGALNYDSGVCYIKGKRVNVITFSNRDQQAMWNYVAKDSFGPDFYWAKGKGAVVVAKNGNRPAAKIGANRLPGVLVHG